MSDVRRVALKVDCDTFQGTKSGLPNLLRLFDKAKIRASFFFTLGPDRSGRAIRRVFTQKGFLKKMLRSNAVSLYGPRTMLYGTLLPAPMIGQRLKSHIRAVAASGHDVGVHAWDHVRWHDRLNVMSEGEIERDYGLAHGAFEEIFGWRARASAAAGWHATPVSLAIQEKFDLLYASDTRGGAPFFPKVGSRVFKFLEIPTTLPTWDETLGDPAYRDKEAFIEYYRDAVRGAEVHTLHTEVEGTAHLPLFERLIRRWQADGVSFSTLEEVASQALLNKEHIPQREINRVTLPNRAGLVSSARE